MRFPINLADFAASLLYSFLGIAIFCLTFIVIDKLTPYDLWKEIVEHKNTALGMVVAGLCLGVCLIIAAAIH
jgi:uncharacterized membrane protein YjfL (UPF0719 family)